MTAALAGVASDPTAAAAAPASASGASRLFGLHSLSPALGAEVSGLDLSRPLDAATVVSLRAAWLEHLVLRFRGQALTDPQRLAVLRHPGELDPPDPNPYGAPFNPTHPEIHVISDLRDGDWPLGNLGDGEAVWHQDRTCIDHPPMASMLYAIEVPPSGGDTCRAIR